MDQKKIFKIVFSSLIVIAAVSLLWWLLKDPTKKFVVSLPGLDNRAAADSSSEKVDIGKIFQSFSTDYKVMKETWPRFRGSDFDNISKSTVRLKEKFPASGPEIRWTLALGEGHAGAAIYKGLVYVFDYGEKERADLLRCFALIDGKELWRRGYNVTINRNHGMSRTIPAVTDK